MKPQLRISVFLDYVCPFCYVGNHRLLRLEDTYDLRVNWAYIEIHPHTPLEGVAPEALDYTPQRRAALDTALATLATADGLTLAPRRIVPNTRHAMRLAEAAKDLGRAPFYRLHNTLFHAYFVEGRDIGNDAVLHDIAAECGLPAELPGRAWSENAALDARFARYQAFAAAAGVSGVPTFSFGRNVLPGVQSEETLRTAAAELLGAEDSSRS